MYSSLFLKKDLGCLPEKVIFLDFDGTVALPARKGNGEYDIQPDGSIGATHLNKEKFRRLVQFAIQTDIPLYFLSGRTDLQSCVDLMTDFIASVDGFHSGIGGFKKDSLFFISKMIIEEGKLVRKEITTKAQVIQSVHHEKYSYLPKESILLVDDIQEYLDPAQELGYNTLLANPESLEHFDEVEKFIGVTLQKTIAFNT